METFENFLKRKQNRETKMKDIGRQGFYVFKREAVTYMVQHNTDEKYYIIERLKLTKLDGKITNKNSKIGQIEYRIGYYIVGRIGRAKNKWTWGQYCPMIPKEDFKKLLNKAHKEKTIL